MLRDYLDHLNISDWSTAKSLPYTYREEEGVAICNPMSPLMEWWGVRRRRFQGIHDAEGVLW
jgi:hypothetical protein